MFKSNDGVTVTYYDIGSTECGSFDFSMSNPDSAVFTQTQTPIELVTGTGTAAIAAMFTVSSTDVTKVSPMAPFEQDYIFVMSVTLDAFTVTPQIYDYYISTETSRIDDLTFVLRDYCLGVTYAQTGPGITIPDLDNVVAYVDTPSTNLLIQKNILTPATTFYFTYPTYTTYDGSIDGCGDQDIGMLYTTILPLEEEG